MGLFELRCGPLSSRSPHGIVDDKSERVVVHGRLVQRSVAESL